MFEWHSWATIRASASADDNSGASPSTLARVGAILAERREFANETWDLRSANGAFHLWLAGDHNHADPGIVELFEAVAAAAPGSYGILYTHDDDYSNHWNRWVMRRGQVCRMPDNDLSPHVGLVEDADPELDSPQEPKLP